MKIAIDAHSLNKYQWAGKENYVFNLIKALAVLDKHNIYYLYLNKDLKFDLPVNFNKRIIKAPNIFWHLFVIFDLLFLKPDFYFSPTSFIVPSFKFFTPCIIVVHDLVSFLPKNKKHNVKARIIEKIFLKLACKRAKYIVAISQSTKNDLTSFLKIKSDKIKVIYPSYSSKFKLNKNYVLSGALNKYNLPKNFILFIGTLEPRKNIITLIEAFHDLIVNYKITEYKLVVVGKKGWHYEDIFKKVEELNLKSKIIFTGYVRGKDLSFLYCAAICFVYPSLHEGFGLPVLEAMACGCPVVASNVSSLPEVAGEAAFLFNPYSSKELSNALNGILTDYSLRSKMKQAGLEQVQKFSWTRTAQSIIKLWNT